MVSMPKLIHWRRAPVPGRQGRGRQVVWIVRKVAVLCRNFGWEEVCRCKLSALQTAPLGMWQPRVLSSQGCGGLQGAEQANLSGDRA